MTYSNIYLVGMPASGKSFVGKALAERLGWEFIDTDVLIEKQVNTSITDIFKNYGEAHFRTLERELVRKSFPPYTVIATGGGMPCFHNNMEEMLAKGFVICLSPPLPILIQRLSRQQGQRPLVNDSLSSKQLAEQLYSKLNQRQPFYQKAHFSTDDIETKSILNKVLSVLNK